MMNVSQDANEKGFLQAFCDSVLEALYGNDPDAPVEEKENDDDPDPIRSLPAGSKVGFVTFDTFVHFYDCHVSIQIPGFPL